MSKPWERQWSAAQPAPASEPSGAKPWERQWSAPPKPSFLQGLSNQYRASIKEGNEAFKESRARNLKTSLEEAGQVLPAAGQFLRGIPKTFEAAASLNPSAVAEEGATTLAAGLTAAGAGITAPLRFLGAATGIIPQLEADVGLPLEKLTQGAAQGELRFTNPFAKREPAVTPAQMRQFAGVEAPLPEGAQRQPKDATVTVPFDLRVPRTFPTDVAMNMDPALFAGNLVRPRSPTIPANLTYDTLETAVKTAEQAKREPKPPQAAQPPAQPQPAPVEPPATPPPAAAPRTPEIPPVEPPRAPEPIQPPRQPETPPTAVPEAAAPTRPAPVDNWPADVPRDIAHGYGRPDKASVYGALPQGIFGEARYSAFSPEVATEYGPNIVTSKADLKNPLVLRSDADWDALRKEAGFQYAAPQSADDIARLRKIVQDRGHDGVVVWFEDTPYDVDNSGQSIKRIRSAFDHPQVIDFGRRFGPGDEAPPANAKPAPGAAAAPSRAGGVTLPDEGVSDKSADHAGVYQRWEAEGFAARDRLERGGRRTPAPEPLTFSKEERALIPGAIKEAEMLAARVAKAVAEADGGALIDAWADISRRIDEAFDETEVTSDLFEKLDEYAQQAAVHLQERVVTAEEGRLIKEALDEEAAAAQPAAPGARPDAWEPGDLQPGESMVVTPAGSRFRVQPKLVELDDLTHAEGILQNRDREKIGTDLQVQEIIAQFDPERLGSSLESDRGAPIISPESMIESGNGRVMALRKIFDQYPELADNYRAFLQSQGYDVTGMRQPVLVRERKTPMTMEQRARMVRESNKDDKLRMSVVETAADDARRMTADVLQHYRGGDVFSAANRNFVTAFLAKLPATEVGALVADDGGLNVDGIRRVQAALMSGAYSDTDLLTRLLESRDNNIKSIGTGLLDNAANIAALKDDIAQGRVDASLDVADKLVEAAKIVSDYRQSGKDIQDWFDQIDAFSDPDPVVGNFIRMFYNPTLTRAASGDAIAGRLGAFVQRAREQSAVRGLFGDMPMSPREILDGIIEEMTPGARQDDMFGGGTAARRDEPGPPSVLAMLNSDPARRGGSPTDEAVLAAQRESQAADPANQTGSFDVEIEQGQTGGPTVYPRINRGKMTGEARPNPTVPTPKGPLSAPRSIQAMSADLSRILGLTVRGGRGPKGRVLGFFKTKPHVIRLQELQDFDVRAHEAGHHIEFAGKEGSAYPGLKAFFRAHQKVLSQLSYPGVHPTNQRIEGFAEFFRVYLTNPDEVRQAVPGVTADFERVMAAAAPDTLRALQDLQRDYQVMIKADPVSLGMSAIAKYPDQKGFVQGLSAFLKDPKEGFKGLGYGIVHGLVDNLHPIKLMTRAMLKVARANISKSGYRVFERLNALDIAMADDPYYLMKAMPGAINRAYVDIGRGIVPYKGTAPEGPSLIGALAKAEDSARKAKARLGYDMTDEEWTNRFDSYLNSRNMRQQWLRHQSPSEGQTPLEGKPDRFSLDHHEQIIAREEALFPEWADAANDIYDLQNRLWKKLRDAGRMDQDVFRQTMIDHPDYVPAFRDMTDISDSMGAELAKAAGTSTADALEYFGRIARFKGSRRDVLSPTRAIFENITAANLAIAKNDVAKGFLGLTNLPGVGPFVEVIPAKTAEAINVSGEQLAESVSRILGYNNVDAMMIGMVEQVLGDSDGMTMYRSKDAPKKGEQIIHAWVNGKRIDMRLADGKLGRDAYNAIAGLDKLQSDMVLRTIGLPALMLRMGVTNWPTFFVRNVLSDGMAAASLTNVGFIPYVDTLKGLMDEFRQTDVATRYRIGQGIVGGDMAAAARNVRNRNDIGQLRRAGKKVRTFSSAQDLLRAIPTAGQAAEKVAQGIEMGETATRLAIFRKAEQAALNRGLSPYDAMFEASMVARQYMDFDAHGASKWVQGLAHVTPFMTASIQGLRSFFNASTPVEVFSVMIQNVMNPKSKIGLTPAQERQAALMRHAWIAMGMMAGLEMTLRILNKDNPVYDEMTDLRRLNWVIPAGDQVWLIPKPFELALMGNLMSRFYEGAVMSDPRALEEAGKDTAAVMIPPVIPQSFKIYNNLARNRDDFGNAIIPESKKDRVLPADQYGERTGQLAIWMGRELNVSPAQIDYILRNVAGYASRDLMNQIDAATTPGIAQIADVTRLPVTSRFAKDPTRNSRSSREFWKIAAAFGGEMGMSRGSFHAALQSGDINRAQSVYNAATAYERSWMMLTAPGVNEEYKKVHPMYLYPKVVGSVGDMATDLMKGDIVDPSGAAITLTPEQRQDAVRALNWAGLSMKVNALRDIQAEGYEDAPRWPQEEYIRTLYGIDPRLYAALNARVYKSGVKVTLDQIPALRNTWLDTMRPWSEQRLSREDMEIMSGIKKTTGKGKALRDLREIIPAR